MPTARGNMIRYATSLLLLLMMAGLAKAQTPQDLLRQPDEWFTSDEGRRVLSNVLSWQQPSGGWWKAYDVSQPRPDGFKFGCEGRSTFDNNATWSELRLLARAYRQTEEPAYRDAFERGLAMTLDAQYPNGGWPQQVPPPGGYGRHVTFNDGVMVSVLRLMKNIAAGEGDFAFVPADERRRAAEAYMRGIDCILDAQIHIDGQLTVWCAQYDAETLKPAKARSYELPSLSGGESAEVVLLLMEIENPDERVITAIESAVRWFERAKLTGIRLERVEAPELPRGFDVRVMADPQAEPLWARFYDLDTGEPFFCGRDGVKKGSLAEIEAERRTGYAWLRPWGKKVLDAYPQWAETYLTEPPSSAELQQSPVQGRAP